jgi:hypothetical protein
VDEDAKEMQGKQRVQKKWMTKAMWMGMEGVQVVLDS